MQRYKTFRDYFTPIKSIPLVILLIFVLGVAIAQATCTSTGNAYICSSPPTDSTSYNFSFVNGTTGSATNWTLTGGGLFAHTNSGNNTFTGDTITATNAGVNGTGVIHITTAPGGRDAEANVSNSSIQVTTGNSHAIAAHANNTVGNATMNIANTRVNMASTAGNLSGLIVLAGGSGKATLNMVDSHIATANPSDSVQVISGSGDVEVHLIGSTIDSTGANSRGLHLQSGASGTITASSNADITTSGASAHGIYGQAANGKIDITNTGAIRIDGDASAKGIWAIASGTGEVVIGGSGDINMTNAGDSSGHGVYAQATSGNAAINYSGKVTTRGDDASGLRILASGTGNAAINYSGSQIEVSGNDSDAIYAYSVNGNASVTAQGTLITHSDNGTGSFAYGIVALSDTGSVDITFTGTRIDVDGNDSAAIYANSRWFGSGPGDAGHVSITNSGELIARGGSSDKGIWTESNSGNQTIVNSGAITTWGSNSSGIATLSTSGNQTITNNGAINTSGNDSSGIATSSISGNQTITNNAAITTQGTNSHGINAFSNGGSNVNLSSSGNIAADGSTLAGGILINATTSHIITDISGNITTVGTISPAIALISTRNDEGLTSNLLYYHDGIATIGAGSDAISLWAGGASTTGSGEVRIGPNVIVDASRGFSAVQNLMPEESLINIASGAQIIGGSATGIDIDGQRVTLNTAGIIGAMNDLAIRNSAYPVTTQQMSIANLSGGVLTGFITLDDATNTMVNAGTWNLRNFADTDGDLVRDTLSVSVSNFGTSGTNGIVNAGTITLLGDGGTATSLNATDAYDTGYTVNNMVIGGAVQAQVLNVATFSNNGLIDLSSGNPIAGDVLRISGGTTLGISGGGVYIANSGSRLRLDTVFNEGGANSQSDMLVVDSTRLGTGATTIIPVNVAGTGALTTGNGIELVRVLNATQSAPDTFRLDGRIVQGLYEYDLYRGSVQPMTPDGNWYLRSITIPSASSSSPPSPSLRPEPHLYVRNMAAASGMFIHTLHDRLGEPQYTDTYRDSNNASGETKVPAGWARVVGSHANSESADGHTDLDTDTSLIHFGSDIARWSDLNDNRYHFGVMGAYGTIDTDAHAQDVPYTNNGLRRKASGDVKGYSVGVYGTWYGNGKKPEGPYLDTWALYGWYKNTVRGNGLAEEKYDSEGWTVSLEGGYAWILRESKIRQWMIEPQVQVAYNAYNEDDHQEVNGTWINNSDANGWITRVGARLYSRSKQNDNGIQPFIEANWWHSSAKNSLDFNGQSVSDGVPSDRYEFKAGLQGEIKRNWQLWGHLGTQWGKDNYDRYEALVGIKYVF